MKILVTGGSGFLGSHLCDLLLSKGNGVICVDNLITGDVANIEHLKDNKDFEFIQQDLTDHISIDTKIDYILHFASPASPVDFPRIPIQILKAGALGTLNALELAARNGARFLLASSSEVYGDALVSPQREDYWGNVNTLGIRGAYDESKRFAEALTMAYMRKRGIDTRIARIFNTYGPRMRKNDGRVVITFIAQALDGESLTVFGDGSQTRSFCYVSDLVDGIYKLMLSDINEPVNLGNPEELPILELARRIIQIAGSQSQIIYKTLPENDPKMRRPDIARAQKLLEWSPLIPLKDGLSKTIDWFNQVERTGEPKKSLLTESDINTS